MTPSRIVELLPHNPAWAGMAAAESARLKKALGEIVIAVHHIGSTSIPTIAAKPTIDLLPLVTSLEALDAQKEKLIALGYEYRGEFGIPTRRYCPLTDLATGKRLFHAHFFSPPNPHVDRHLAFRDYLIAHPDQAREYETVKLAAAAQYPNDLSGYCDYKDAWIKSCEQRAMTNKHHRENAVAPARAFPAESNSANASQIPPPYHSGLQ
jgi:GrpB-like predicted nucleotidyltransferase (UPF0157 family)